MGGAAGPDNQILQIGDVVHIPGDPGTFGFAPYQGVLDEVALYDHALSSDEILTHYNNFVAGNNYFVPEASSFVLLVMGLAGWASMRRWRK